MSTFGHKLRYERESRNTRIQEVAERTHIGLRYLEALENNDFDALPGPRGFAKLYIRAYADVLGFDPEALIEAFEQERRRQARADGDRQPPARPRARRISYEPPPLKPVETEPEPEPEPELAAEPEPDLVEEPEPELAAEPEPIVELEHVAEPQACETTEPPQVPLPETARPPARWVIGLSLIAVALLIATVSALRPGSVADFADSVATPAAADPEPPAAAAATPSPPEPEAEPAANSASPGRIRVAASGVGTGVIDRRLVGRGTRFEEGSEVFFFTRVVGGGSGQRLRHVWLQEGRVIQSIELSPVRSPDWRTYSSKTLWRKGNWTVEARTQDDKVLARAEFSCEPS